ncbi:hypothetical protein chiPu_0000073 [Chiloscyllium punctatum]|uniref:Uncharacterized protein n=1 Tax=Chiloscyllium punctatum TaxID=137246 RepID=A0A401RN86_CHIPU|nr:hypothetical protein [Chiloscyllium punctatum]
MSQMRDALEQHRAVTIIACTTRRLRRCSRVCAGPVRAPATGSRTSRRDDAGCKGACDGGEAAAFGAGLCARTERERGACRQYVSLAVKSSWGSLRGGGGSRGKKKSSQVCGFFRTKH